MENFILQFITFAARKTTLMKFAYTYIMTNKGHTTLYTGCTNDLVRRVSEHKSHKYIGSFTDKYNCEYCVYYKEFTRYQSAIDEENRIKHMTRAEKFELIESINPEWKELVTEKGFVFDKTLWSERENKFLTNLKVTNNEIPATLKRFPLRGNGGASNHVVAAASKISTSYKSQWPPHIEQTMPHLHSPLGESPY